jgi:hypothetical protein
MMQISVGRIFELLITVKTESEKTTESHLKKMMICLLNIWANSTIYNADAERWSKRTN